MKMIYNQIRLPALKPAPFSNVRFLKLLLHKTARYEKGMVIRMIDEKELIRAAMQARAASYAPYSGFRVGAAIFTKDNKVYAGCNVENASYGATNCAERTAAFKAVSEGNREFQAIAIVGSAGEEITDYAFPCGVCRQVLREFCNPETMVVLVAKSEED